MSVITTPIHDATGRPPHGDNYINHSKGILSWLLTLDHKRIGLMYMVCVLGAFARKPAQTNVDINASQ